MVLKEEGVPFQAIRTVNHSNDPHYETKNRVLELYDMAPGSGRAGTGRSGGGLSLDEFGPLNLLPRPGRPWAPKISRRDQGDPHSPRRRRRRTTYKRPSGVRHLLAGTLKLRGPAGARTNVRAHLPRPRTFTRRVLIHRTVA
jgi:hypothetical protein